MELPDHSPVIVLSDVVFFPGTMLPLHIFEPRYREALKDALESNRFFSVAQRVDGRSEEEAASVAGLGLIRASVTNSDGTSNMILQGVARVRLGPPVEDRNYPYFRVFPLEGSAGDPTTSEALAHSARELALELLEVGASAPPVLLESGDCGDSAAARVVNGEREQFAERLQSIQDPELLGDYISGSLLACSQQRQEILATGDLCKRLEILNRYISAEISRFRP